MSRVLPLAGFVLILALLGFGIWWSQHNDPRAVPSPLIGKPAPAFALPKLYEPQATFGSADLACRDEHPILMREGKSLGVKLVGFNYKDEPADAKRWLAQYGDPYDIVIADYPGDVAIDFGVTGAPETFLVDGAGVIRYKYISPIKPEVIATELLPRIAALKGATR